MRARRDWKSWLRRWDEQQESFNPERERRFSAMLDVVAATQPKRFRALDLGSGPGPLSLRLLRRFPGATVTAVDYDPVVLRVGRGALGTYRGRLTWVDAKLGAPGWRQKLPPGKYHAALSTTALHWLRPRPLRALYRDLRQLLRPGGVLLNGDHLPWPADAQRFAKISAGVRRARYPVTTSHAAWAAWHRWWTEVGKVPELEPLFRLREERRSEHPKTEGDLAVDEHRRALLRAGFRSVDVVWQDFENRVLCAVN